MTVPIEPPDLFRCQGESREPHQPFRLGFPAPRWERCRAEPVVMLVEPSPSEKDGLRGVMTVCQACLAVFHQQSGCASEEPIAPYVAAWRLGGPVAVVRLLDELGVTVQGVWPTPPAVVSLQPLVSR